jgi:uncharacterized membrane protein
MKKRINLSVIAIVLLTFLFTTSCTKDEVQNNTTFERHFNIKTLKSKASKTDISNYKISSVTSNVDFLNEQINIEFPVPLNDFSFTRAYNITNGGENTILVVITRNSTEEVVNLPEKYLVQTNISFDEVNLDSNSLENTENLNIFVMNTTRVFENNTEAIEVMNNLKTSRNDSADGPDVSEFGQIIL